MSIVLVGNLSRTEARRLIDLLRQSRIESFAKEEGYGNMRRIKSGTNFEDRHIVLIDENDEIEALKILQQFRMEMQNELKLKETTCPKCRKSGSNIIIQKLNFIQRLFYIGTIPKSCTNCGEHWY